MLEGMPAGVEVHDRGHRRRSWPAAGSGTAAARGCRSSRTRSSSPAASGTAAPWAARSRSRSATPSGRSGRRSCPPTRSTAEVLAGQARNAPLTRPRPGHADLAGMQKYGFDDARPGAGAGQRPRDRGPGGARRGRAGVPRARRSASRWSATWSRSARCRRPTACCPARRTTPRIDEDPVRCSDPATSARDGRRDRRRPEERRHPRRRRRGRRPRPAAGAGQPRALGPPAGLPAGRRADGHPGDQGRRGRRRLGDRRGAAARWRTTRSMLDADGGAARAASPTGPAASRAA